jgi:NAD(P)-dependent dehydrogenase (short-subunit alcohol dehydrogenase family)
MNVDYDRSAVITGAASGIGRELSLVYARRGWKIGLVDINMDEAAKTLEMVEKVGGTGETFKCNVREFDEVQAMADHFLDGWGKIGLLVNNAGVAAAGSVGDMPLEEWRRVIETNFWGVVYGCHTFVPRMKEQGAGHILNIGSIAGIAPIPEMPSYNTAKAGVISLSETLRIELAPYGIGVTVLCPYFLNTNIFNSTTFTDDFQEEVAREAMANVHMTVEEAVRRTVAAVDKNKLYIFPQWSARLSNLAKRISPSGYIGLFAYLNKIDALKPMLLKTVQKGLL